MSSSSDETLVADSQDAATMLADELPAHASAPPDSRRPPGLSSPTARGSSIGRYIVLDMLGQGGMGVVYAAYDPELDRKVALKLLRPKGKDLELATTRLQREAQAMAKLSHPHVVTVHDVGQHEGKVFVAMEFVEGETLRDWVEAGDRDIHQTLALFRKAGAGLAAAHAVGLVHRDFKPENVLLGADGRVRVADFGLARTTDEAGSTLTNASQVPDDLGRSSDDLYASASRTGVSLSSRVTRTGAFLGTPAYMSPEQFKGGELGPPSDQFSFAVALWEALYKERPFAGDSPSTLAFQVLHGERREAPKNSPVPRRVRVALERALSLDPSARFVSMEALLGELAEPKSKRWVLPAAFGAIALGAVAWTQLQPAAEPPDPCAGGPERLAQVWNDAERERLAASLSKVDAVWAKDTKIRSLARIDAWGESFVAAHRDACEATEVLHTQSPKMGDLRMLCLDRRLRRLDAIKETLHEADAKQLRRASRALSALDDLEACADPETLTQRDPLPTDPKTREAILALQGVVEKATSLRKVGRLDDALKLIRGRLSEAETLAYRPVLAELNYELGRSLGDKGEDEESHKVLFAAFRGALESGEDKAAARASAALVSSAEELERRDGADRWFEITEALCLRLGGAPGIRAALHMNRGNSLRARGDLEGALAANILAHELYVESRGPDTMEAGDAIYNRSGVEWDMGRHNAALTSVDSAVKIWRKHVGDDHPRIIAAQAAQAMFALHSGDTNRAISLQEGVIAKRIKLHGEDSIQVADSRLNLSAIAAGAEDFQLGWDAAQLAMRYYESAGKKETIGYAQLMGNASMCARNLDRAKEAETLARGTFDILGKKLGEGHPHVATAMLMIGLAVEDQGRLDEAYDQTLQATAILETSKGSEFQGLIEMRMVLARIERKRGRLDAALQQIKLGTPITQSPDAAPENVGLFWLEASEVAKAQGDTQEADAARARARRSFEAAGAAGAKQLARIEAG